MRPWARLSGRQVYVLSARDCGTSFEEIAKALGVSRERAREITVEARTDLDSYVESWRTAKRIVDAATVVRDALRA